MVSTKDLRDMFDDLTKEAGKKANDALKNVDVPVGRSSEPPGMLWLGIGLVLGAAIGMLVAAVFTPYSGQEARQRIGEQVDKVRRSREDVSTNGSSLYSSPTAATTPTSPYERS